jgi:hypothetical protein
VRSRRGWKMTERLPELGDLPAGCVFDGAASPRASKRRDHFTSKA